MNNVMRIVNAGVCTGCNACSSCEHITFEWNQYGFYSPVVDDKCDNCGKCVEKCVYDPDRENDDD